MNRKRWIVAAGIVLSATGGAVALVRSGVTAVASVRVRGAGQLDPQELRRASGIEPGMNALTLDLAAAEARLEQVPLVGDATIARDGAFDIVITVTERAPSLLVRTPFARRAVDADAIVMELPPEPTQLPELRIDRLPDLEPETVRAVLRLWDRMSATEQRRARISWGEVNGLTLELGPLTIRLGAGEELAAKLDAVRSIRRSIPGAIRRIDVSQLPRIAVT